MDRHDSAYRAGSTRGHGLWPSGGDDFSRVCSEGALSIDLSTEAGGLVVAQEVIAATGVLLDRPSDGDVLLLKREAEKSSLRVGCNELGEFLGVMSISSESSIMCLTHLRVRTSACSRMIQCGG